MTTYFKHIAQITARADYDKILRKALATPGQEPFHYFDAFPFDKKEAPLVLVGDVGKPLIADLKKLVPKAQYGMGVCTVTAKDEIIFERETGKLQPKLVSATVKLSGIKSTVKFNGEDDEEEGERAETENDEGQPEEPQVKATGKVPPAPPLPPSNKPSGDKPTTLSPQAKEFQDKLKVLRPAFDNALKKARELKKTAWEEDLDSNFTQMVQEAKAGKFDVALQTLARLARMTKGEEASRAEVKHQANKEDTVYAEMHKTTVRDNASPEDMKQARKANKAGGYGVTEDGNVAYALPLKPGEWKSGVVDRIDGIFKILSADKVDFNALHQTYNNLPPLLQRARQHAEEGNDKQHQDRADAIDRLSDHLTALDDEVGKINALDPAFPIPRIESVLKDCGKLKDLIETLEHPNKPSPDVNEIEAFKKKSGERSRLHKATLDKEAEECNKLEQELREQAIALKEDAPRLPQDEINTRRQELEEMKTTLDLRRKDLLHATRFGQEIEKKAEARFINGVANPQQLAMLLKLADDIKGMIDRTFYQQAVDAIQKMLAELVFQDFAQDNSVEQQITIDLESIQNDLLRHAQRKAASPMKAARMAKRLHGEAIKVGALMD
ncbi:MAG: hypothetical protein WAQ08_14235 [Aquabacterium sp.]|uniref:hypothetical protein n=1 Tax=Aquabacterium sp. TaxID=1872578 RepID=UPI003BB07358